MLPHSAHRSSFIWSSISFMKKQNQSSVHRLNISSQTIQMHYPGTNTRPLILLALQAAILIGRSKSMQRTDTPLYIVHTSKSITTACTLKFKFPRCKIVASMASNHGTLVHISVEHIHIFYVQFPLEHKSQVLLILQKYRTRSHLYLYFFSFAGRIFTLLSVRGTDKWVPTTRMLGRISSSYHRAVLKKMLYS